MRGKDCFIAMQERRGRITPAHAGKRQSGHNLSSQCQDHPRPCGEKFSFLKSVDFIRGSPPPMRGKERVAMCHDTIGRITPAHAGKSLFYQAARKLCKDHPRPCGEKWPLLGVYHISAGSPPPMRGKDMLEYAADILNGITPAHAGKRCVCSRHFAPREDHPRPCGEKDRDADDYKPQSGSPPPMRGKVYMKRRLKCYARITPAHAGKSRSRHKDRYICRDHPRPCGEKRRPGAGCTAWRGSPPPMRGKAAVEDRPDHFGGITPAHAGKSIAPRAAVHEVRDHPRPCGEKWYAFSNRSALAGSPPPMRGKGAGLTTVRHRTGITPAHAGKRFCCYEDCKCFRDHPRPCGEKITVSSFCRLWEGSPPPMRGKVLGVIIFEDRAGITPAHAGKSAALVRSLRCLRDHPRPCGEKSIRDGRSSALQGSPPPMRGKERSWPSRSRALRITPAHAGKSY